MQELIGDSSGIAMSQNNLGQIFESLGDIQKALICYNVSRKIQEATGNEQGLALVYNNIGLVYKKQGEFVKALD